MDRPGRERLMHLSNLRAGLDYLILAADGKLKRRDTRTGMYQKGEKRTKKEKAPVYVPFSDITKRKRVWPAPRN